MAPKVNTEQKERADVETEIQRLQRATQGTVPLTDSPVINISAAVGLTKHCRKNDLLQKNSRSTATLEPAKMNIEQGMVKLHVPLAGLAPDHDEYDDTRGKGEKARVL